MAAQPEHPKATNKPPPPPYEKSALGHEYHHAEPPPYQNAINSTTSPKGQGYGPGKAAEANGIEEKTSSSHPGRRGHGDDPTPKCLALQLVEPLLRVAMPVHRRPYGSVTASPTHAPNLTPSQSQRGVAAGNTYLDRTLVSHAIFRYMVVIVMAIISILVMIYYSIRMFGSK
ncbi:hypothetical protein F5Y14DRAFT_451577 [Nemania sp. NC0429]|nr:hypothetical protein F5Y14DRAFT_451577 [Nemania sp. NC0429]